MNELLSGIIIGADIFLTQNGTEGELPWAGMFLIATIFFVMAGALSAANEDTIRRAIQTLRVRSFTSDTVGEKRPAAVNGTVSVLEETITGPVSGAACVAYESEKQMYRRRYRYDRERRKTMKRAAKRRNDKQKKKEAEKKRMRWVTVSTQNDAVPFLVETNEGPVAIEAGDASKTLPLQAKEGGAGFLRRALHSAPLLSLITGLLGNTKPRRELEHHIKPGDSVVVIGDPREPTLTDEAIAEITDGADLFLLTTKSRSNLFVRSLIGMVMASIPAMILAVLGFIAFLAGVGMLAGII